MSRHDNTSTRMRSILTTPQTRHRLLLRIELHTGFSVKGACATTGNTLLISSERKHGQGHRDGNVDTQLAGFDVLLESGGGGAGGGEDGGAVAVFVCVCECDGVVEGVDVEADQDGAEDFFFVAGHVGCDVGDDCGGDLIQQLAFCINLHSKEACLPSFR